MKIKHEHKFIEAHHVSGSHMTFKCGCGKTNKLSLDTSKTKERIEETCLACKGNIRGVSNCKENCILHKHRPEEVN